MSLTVSHGLDSPQPLPLAKTVLDRSVAAVLLLLAAPWMALLAVALWRHDDGPVLRRDLRLGQWGRPFHQLRFRTTGPGGPVTGPCGALLRVACLDELPQLVNVLRGEMSLVGPRASTPTDGRRTPTTLARVALRPGLVDPGPLDPVSTGAPGSAVDRYVREWSLRLDLVILGRALGRAVRGPAA
ncbi:sugar transferase [Modestobacter sp. SSW1-42]|uniref:sugar transferase n=1 Tax=Modestobacter sp. SSW1-42 TaxID=596372 RepID=UPI0039880BCE